ncbi:phage protease [Verrucomicrobium spinosum]|uniref:phage protease n=1 Tax=Verrucomicrobium spinosum TaxID=2736 RepID=UPI0012F629E9|nr:phage protease [Verrucomicrobium spinosum]
MNKETSLPARTLRTPLARVSGIITAAPKGSDASQTGSLIMRLLKGACKPFAPIRVAVANAAVANSVLAGPFEVLQAESMFVPYGKYPHRLGMQIFDRAEAEAMARAWNSVIGRARRWFEDCPVYIGHPDVPGLEAEYPDKSAYGWIQNITAENDGARFQVKWGPEGAALVANAKYRFYSPHWNCEQRNDGLHPASVISFGLTNRSNIPVPPLANSAPTNPDPPTEDPMKPSPQLLALLGLTETADEAAVIQAITSMKEKCTSMENEVKNLKSAQTGAEQAKMDAEAAKTQAENAVKTANAAAAAARSSRVEMAMDSLVATGRVVIADRPAETTRLLALANEADVTTELGKLHARTPLVKTTSSIGNPAGHQAAAKSPQLQAQDAQRVALENAVATERQRLDGLFGQRPENYDLAWTNLQATKPELFTKVA